MPNKIDFLRNPDNVDHTAFLAAVACYVIAFIIVIAVITAVYNGAPFSWADIGIALILTGLGGIMHRAAMQKMGERQTEDLERRRR